MSLLYKKISKYYWILEFPFRNITYYKLHVLSKFWAKKKKKKKYWYMWKKRNFKKRENWFRDKGVICYVILHFARHQYRWSILLTRGWVANSTLERVKTLIKSELMKTTFGARTYTGCFQVKRSLNFVNSMIKYKKKKILYSIIKRKKKCYI